MQKQQSNVFKNDENVFKASLVIKVCLIFSSALLSFLIISILDTFKFILQHSYTVLNTELILKFYYKFRYFLVIAALAIIITPRLQLQFHQGCCKAHIYAKYTSYMSYTHVMYMTIFWSYMTFILGGRLRLLVSHLPNSPRYC